ncbi:MAG: helix-turn-helix transcriptional regulator [Bacteroidales bacterium]|nr:helix-turn-helix transcriptional regulator [Bacteroidales bacterium]
MNIKTVNIGELIRLRVESLGMSKSKFAEKLNIARQNIEKTVFSKHSIDTNLLCAICNVLDYNFFAYFKDKTMNQRYYLRGGDFRPEEVNLDNMQLLFGKYITLDRAEELLSQNHNIFPTKELALQASAAVRSFLAVFDITRSEPARLNPQTHTQLHNIAQPPLIVCIQTPSEETPLHVAEPQAPNA